MMGNGAIRSRVGSLAADHASCTDDVHLQVAHYIHPMFHLDDTELTQAQIQTCKDTFQMVFQQGGNSHIEKEYENEGEAKEKEPEDEQKTKESPMVSDFYNTLHERIPATKGLFSNEIKVQSALLSRMIHTILSLVEKKNSEVCKKLLQDVALAHNSFNVHPAFYSQFAHTFICTLRKHLGEVHFGQHENQSWVVFWSYVLHTMMPTCVLGTWGDLGSASTFAPLNILPGALQLSVKKTLEDSNLEQTLVRGEAQAEGEGAEKRLLPPPTGAELLTAPT